MNEMSTMYCSSNYLSLRTKVYEDVDKLRRRTKAALEELDQRIIDTAVRQWRTRLHVCVKAKGVGDHFEHKLPWLNDEMPDKLFNHSILAVGFYYDLRIFDQMRR